MNINDDFPGIFIKATVFWFIGMTLLLLLVESCGAK